MSQHHSIPEPVIVTAREHLEELGAELRETRQLALDIESNGFYAYREKVCLLQMSTPSSDYIVDPVAIKDLSRLAPLMADPAIEKIFHAGEYDVLCLKRDYGFTFANVFDTMIAVRLLGIKEIGLAATIEKYFGIKLSKKLQRSDWGRRPLTPEQLRYAQMDTHYLIALTRLLKADLDQKGRGADAAEAFAELAALEPEEKAFDPEGYWRLSAGHKLAGDQMGAFKALYLLREEKAQSRNRAPFRILPESLMLHLAQGLPEDMDSLKNAKGMTPYLFQRYGRELLEAIEKGRHGPPPTEPPRRRGPSRNSQEWKLFEALRLWRKEQALREDVEPVVIISSETLRRIARAACEEADPLQSLSSLKRSRYGAALEGVLKKKDSL
ncbi:MAG: HRDC domain-containing protein [Elusimicrobia bacterium]|nr:HRDC domain-containing protein [Elusimicrobiota bacterium]